MPLTRRQSREKEDEWITCQSKSRPGRQYLFNKASGQTRWLPLQDSDSKHEATGGGGDSHSPSRKPAEDAEAMGAVTTPASTPPPMRLSVVTRNPAQDRLKRLQGSLKRDRKFITKTTSSSKSLAMKPQFMAERPSTSGITLKESKSFKSSSTVVASETKSSLPAAAAQETPSPTETLAPPTTVAAAAASVQKTTTTRSPKKGARKRRGSSRTPPKSPVKAKLRKSPAPSTQDENDKEELSTNPTTTTSEPTTRFGNGLVNKIRQICKNTYKNATRSLESGIKKSTFKIPKKATSTAKSDALSKPTGSADMQKALNELRSSEQCRELSVYSPRETSLRILEMPKKIQMTTPPPLANTPKNLVIPSYDHGSANSRLARLRRSLLHSAKEAQSGGNRSTNESPQVSVYHSAASSSSNEDIEPMDWQPSETIEINDSDTTINVKKEHAADMSEYYDIVNENLLRFDAEKQNIPPPKWLNDHYYFVIDTNTMLHNLTFIDDLSTMKLCDTNGTIIFIPYVVLQELDKLKMRTASESVKTRTVRAIKFLNLKFESRNKNIQAQSAIDERIHLIDVTSADDSILNCCLQVKQHVDHLILLTEDNNLRNKASPTKVLASTISDLVSKHPVKSDAGGSK